MHKHRRGAAIVEYGLLLGLLSVASLLAFSTLGEALGTLFDQAAESCDPITR